jgi:hypothetical protein
MTTQEEINILKGAVKSLELPNRFGDSSVLRALIIERINDVISSLESK